jgi:hypothetical protein
MPKRQAETDPVLEKLDAIHATLQDMFIVQAKLAGVSKPAVRAILGVGMNRVTRVWQRVDTDAE